MARNFEKEFTMTLMLPRRAQLTMGALAVAALIVPVVPPATAQTAAAEALSAERIAACLEDRRGAGCSTVLVQVMVCAQAPAIPGCEEINALAEAAAEEIEAADPEVDVRAEGELTDPADEDSDDAEAADTPPEDEAENDGDDTPPSDD